MYKIVTIICLTVCAYDPLQQYRHFVHDFRHGILQVNIKKSLVLL